MEPAGVDMAIAGIPAVTASRVTLPVTQMIIQLAFQRALDHHLRQPARQAALAGQLQPAGARPLSQLPQQLLAGRRQLRAVLALTGRQVCHWCLLVRQELHR